MPLASSTAPGDGTVTTSSGVPAAVRAARRSARMPSIASRFGSSAVGSMHATTPGATKRAIVSMWPSVWSFWSPRSSHTTWSTPRDQRSRDSSAAASSPGFRAPPSRHCRVVRTVPAPSTSTAPPSRTKSNAAPRVCVHSRMRVDTSVSPGMTYLPPQPSKRKRAAVSSRVSARRSQIGPVSRSQMSP